MYKKLGLKKKWYCVINFNVEKSMVINGWRVLYI